MRRDEICRPGPIIESWRRKTKSSGYIIGKEMIILRDRKQNQAKSRWWQFEAKGLGKIGNEFISYLST